MSVKLITKRGRTMNLNREDFSQVISLLRDNAIIIRKAKEAAAENEDVKKFVEQEFIAEYGEGYKEEETEETETEETPWKRGFPFYILVR